LSIGPRSFGGYPFDLLEFRPDNPHGFAGTQIMISSSPVATLVGRFLVAAPSMPDERFQRSVVFMCKHDDDGALGIIVNNKVDDLPLGQVYRQLGIEVPQVAAPQPVLFGGPVETARGLVLHSADYRREETMLIEGGLALTASLEILKDMAGGSGPRQAWLALGHSGWSAGQLDRELQDNAWLVVDADAALVFDPDLDAKWQRALDRLGGKSGGAGGRFDPASYSHQVGRA
jgi:putative transcriptional regulator